MNNNTHLIPINKQGFKEFRNQEITACLHNLKVLNARLNEMTNPEAKYNITLALKTYFGNINNSGIKRPLTVLTYCYILDFGHKVLISNTCYPTYKQLKENNLMFHHPSEFKSLYEEGLYENKINKRQEKIYEFIRTEIKEYINYLEHLLPIHYNNMEIFKVGVITVLDLDLKIMGSNKVITNEVCELNFNENKLTLPVIDTIWSSD